MRLNQGVSYLNKRIKTIEKLQSGFHMVLFKNHTRGFPGGAVLKNPSANARDMGSSPGPRRSHMPRSS